MIKLNLKIIYTCLLLLPALVFAGEDNQVTVSIKSIACSEEKAAGDGKLTVDPQLQGLKKKLKDIPYKDFNLACSKSVVIPMKEKQHLTLDDGDKLSLELLYVDEERVGLWIDWRDPKGMQLLDTRMHFGCHETMLAGADGGEDSNSGKVLAIAITEKN